MLYHQYTARGNRRFPHGLSEGLRKQQDCHVRAFLAHVGPRLGRLQDLQSQHAADFINETRMQHGERRAYLYALSLARMAKRFHLAMTVRPTYRKIEQKRTTKLVRALDTVEDLTADQRLRILAAIKEAI